MLRPLLQLLLLTTTLAAADHTFTSDAQRVPLVELFTSEGCSSCPRADAWLSSLQDNPGLWKQFVPLAFHVDYWDGLGWPDRFAKRQWTERQRAYARQWRSRSVYTPGFAIDGKEWRGFFRRESLPSTPAINPGNLSLHSTNGLTWQVTFIPAQARYAKLAIHLARLTTDKETKVTAGENRGRNLHHDFIVLDLTSNPLDKKATIQLPPLPKNQSPTALAAWITNGTDPTPIQATGGWLRQTR